MRKALYSTLFLVMIVGLASGMSFGSYVSETQKTVDGRSAEFSINMMNLGEEELKVSLSSRDAETGTVTTPSEIPLPPSEVTKNPENSIEDDGEWLLLSDGKYVKTKKIPVVFVANGGSEHKFTVDLNAEVSGNPFGLPSGSDYTTAQKVVQSRSYSFEVSTSSLPGSGNENRETPDENSQASSDSQRESSSITSAASSIADRARNILNSGSESEQSSGEDRSQDSGNEQNNNMDSSEFKEAKESEINNNNVQSGSSDSQATGGFFEQTASDPVTKTLLAGVMVSIGYLMMVIAG